MFSELPKLFDRNFAVGFFLPFAVFISISGVMLEHFKFAPILVTFLKTDLLVGTTVIGLISWVGGIVLMAINRDLYRLLEGYGKANPVKLLSWFEKKRYKKTINELEKLDDEYSKCQKTNKIFPVNSRIRRNRLMKKLSEEFPDEEEFLLPTPFGNVLRSFEVYPRVMYGLESIDGWGRLLAVIPKEYIEMIDSAKAQVDFWINMGLVIALLQLEYIWLIYTTNRELNLWVVLIFLVFGLIPVFRATSAAKEWGDFIKSAFDMFIPKMIEELDFEPPNNRNEEIKQLTSFSQAIIYRIPDRIPKLKNRLKNKK